MHAQPNCTLPRPGACLLRASINGPSAPEPVLDAARTGSVKGASDSAPSARPLAKKVVETNPKIRPGAIGNADFAERTNPKQTQTNPTNSCAAGGPLLASRKLTPECRLRYKM